MALSLAEQRERALSPPTREQERAAAAERQIEADQARREQERLTKRREIREQIKQRDKLQGDLALLADQLRELDRRADEAAARHTEATTPIQEKLATATGKERDKLVAALTEANVTLERELDIIRRVREPLQKQHRVTRTAMAECKTEAFLVGGDVARPSLLAELFACQQRIKAAEARVETARGYLASYEPELEMARTVPVRPSIEGWGQPNAKPVIDLDRVHNLAERVRRWTCELTHASAELHAAQGASREIERDMIDES